MNDQIHIGWGSASITPDRPVFVSGQLYERVLSYVHDPIAVTALAMSDGGEQAVFVSADMAAIFPDLMERVRRMVDGRDGLDASKITFSATHTHNAAIFSVNEFTKPVLQLVGRDRMPALDIPDDILEGGEALEFAAERFSTAILDAWLLKKPGELAWASDYAAVGFNRRPRFGKPGGEATSMMYGCCCSPDFIGFEGAADHTADMIYTFDGKGALTGTLVAIPCPSQVMELHSFISADYWGYARSAIRAKLGNIHILPICGAAGDQNPIDLVRISKHNAKELAAWNAQAGEVFRNFDMTLECEGIGDRIAEAVDRGHKKALRNRTARPIFKHIVKNLELPIRKVDEADYIEAAKDVKSIAAEFSPANRMTGADMVRLFEPFGIVERWELQNTTSTMTFQSNIIRIGDVAVNTTPFELFVEYALRMRARARAEQVMSFQLTNGVGGYLPTRIAVEGGSYSSKPASTLVGPEGGDAMVEMLIAEMDQLWE